MKDFDKEVEQGLDCYDPETRVFPNIREKVSKGEVLSNRLALFRRSVHRRHVSCIGSLAGHGQTRVGYREAVATPGNEPERIGMTPERWQQEKGVLEKALELLPSERVAFLNQACDGDQELRQEVESLLAAGKEGHGSFLQSPPVMRLGKGTRVGDYEIQSLLGAGGMGEVYRARDVRLRRDVAIKVLPAFVASDPDRLRRFEQGATAAAALNHPNILAVYQMGTHGGAPYLVSE